MKKQTIPFMPVYGQMDDTAAESYSKGAWSFAQTVLWPEQQFSKEELERTKRYIAEYFEAATNKQKSFTAFCERIVLANGYLHSLTKPALPSPAIWFNRNYPQGFAATKMWLMQVQRKRKAIPGYLQHITTVAEHFLQYIFHPSCRIFTSCRKQLLQQKAYSLLQYFYNAIIHFNYIK